MVEHAGAVGKLKGLNARIIGVSTDHVPSLRKFAERYEGDHIQRLPAQGGQRLWRGGGEWPAAESAGRVYVDDEGSCATPLSSRRRAISSGRAELKASRQIEAGGGFRAHSAVFSADARL